MSMYSDLLEASWRAQEQSEREEGTGGDRRPDELQLRRLLDEAIERRRDCVVGAHGIHGHLGAAVDAPSDLARQLAYDLALMRLCVAHGIACDARRFTRPLPERMRLEEALAAKGVVVHDGRARAAKSE